MYICLLRTSLTLEEPLLEPEDNPCVICYWTRAIHTTLCSGSYMTHSVALVQYMGDSTKHKALFFFSSSAECLTIRRTSRRCAIVLNEPQSNSSHSSHQRSCTADICMINGVQLKPFWQTWPCLVFFFLLLCCFLCLLENMADAAGQFVPIELITTAPCGLCCSLLPPAD